MTPRYIELTTTHNQKLYINANDVLYIQELYNKKDRVTTEDICRICLKLHNDITMLQVKAKYAELKDQVFNYEKFKVL